MAAAPKATSENATASDLEADIRQLKADIEKLTEQLARTGEHGYGRPGGRPRKASSS